MAPQITIQDLIERNNKYAQGHTPLPRISLDAVGTPHKLIISCLDPRVHVEEFLGLNINEIGVIRNAGGRARNAVFEAAFLDTVLDITDIIVIHHTNCGLTLNTDEKVNEVLGERSATELAKYDMKDFCFRDVPQSVREDLVFLRNHPFVRKETILTGFVYDIETGKVERVEV